MLLLTLALARRQRLDCRLLALVPLLCLLGLPAVAVAHPEIAEQIELVDRQLAATPDDYLLWAQRGELNRLHGDLLKAIADFERAANLGPDQFLSSRHSR